MCTSAIFPFCRPLHVSNVSLGFKPRRRCRGKGLQSHALCESGSSCAFEKNMAGCEVRRAGFSFLLSCASRNPTVLELSSFLVPLSPGRLEPFKTPRSFSFSFLLPLSSGRRSVRPRSPTPATTAGARADLRTPLSRLCLSPRHS